MTKRSTWEQDEETPLHLTVLGKTTQQRGTHSKSTWRACVSTPRSSQDYGQTTTWLWWSVYGLGRTFRMEMTSHSMNTFPRSREEQLTKEGRRSALQICFQTWHLSKWEALEANQEDFLGREEEASQLFRCLYLRGQVQVSRPLFQLFQKEGGLQSENATLFSRGFGMWPVTTNTWRTMAIMMTMCTQQEASKKWCSLTSSTSSTTQACCSTRKHQMTTAPSLSRSSLSIPNQRWSKTATMVRWLKFTMSTQKMCQQSCSIFSLGKRTKSESTQPSCLKKWIMLTITMRSSSTSSTKSGINTITTSQAILTTVKPPTSWASFCSWTRICWPRLSTDQSKRLMTPRSRRI